MATVSTKWADQIGNELLIQDGDYAVPAEFTLPSELQLKRAYVRHRGILLGSRWYLQSWGRNAEQNSIDLISTMEIDASFDTMSAFLSVNGYRCVDEPCGLYRRQ